MHREEVEKLYRDLPTSQRDRWDVERFYQLAEQPVRDFGVRAAEDVHAEAFRAHRLELPKLENREVGGLACRYGVKVDATWIPSILEPGTFAKSASAKDALSRVKVKYQHVVPIGVPTYLRDLPQGLAAVGRISETSTGNDVITLARDKVVDMFSVGFTPTRYYFKEDKESKDIYRYIQEGDLYEFSLTEEGACPGSDITDVHAAWLGRALADPRIDRVLELLEKPRALALVDLERALEQLEIADADLERIAARLTARRAKGDPTPFRVDLHELDALSRLVGAGG